MHPPKTEQDRQQRSVCTLPPVSAGRGKGDHDEDVLDRGMYSESAQALTILERTLCTAIGITSPTALPIPLDVASIT